MMRTKAFAALGALAMIAAACTTDRTPVAPDATAASGVVAPFAVGSADTSPRAQEIAAPGALPVTIGQGSTLLRDVPLSSDVTVSKQIGAAGGQIDIPAAGLRVLVPRGALSRTTTISATALKGDMVVYEFGPHGTRFALPLVMTQATAGTNADALPAGTVLQLGYFTGEDQLDRVNRKASLAELISGLALVTDRSLIFPVSHFSGYTIVFSVRGNGQGQDWEDR